VDRARFSFSGGAGNALFGPKRRGETVADHTQEWIAHLKNEISGRMQPFEAGIGAGYDELVSDLAWFTFRFARDPDTKMRKVSREEPPK
jgi:hypothetical protein